MRRRIETVTRTFAAAAVVLLASSSGACRDDYFVCTQDSECTQEAGGRCEPSGSCSFPDLECPTGRRYGEAGNPQVAGQCVPASDIGSTGIVETDGGSTSTTTGTTTSATGSTGASEESSSSGTGSTSGTSMSDGSSTGSSTGDASSSSTGSGFPTRELYQPCTMATQDVDCPNSVCAEFSVGPIEGGFCTNPCRDVSDCYDPGVGAEASCIITNVQGTSGASCFLDCSASGADGCLEGMACTPTVQFPDGTQTRVCYWP